MEQLHVMCMAALAPSVIGAVNHEWFGW